MASIKDKPSSQETNRADYRLPPDGPHKYVKREVASEKEKSEEPPYVIAVVKKKKLEDDDKPSRPTSKYDPQELRAKAKTFLYNPNITSKQKEVLKEILGSEEEPTVMKPPQRPIEPETA